LKNYYPILTKKELIDLLPKQTANNEEAYFLEAGGLLVSASLVCFSKVPFVIQV